MKYTRKVTRVGKRSLSVVIPAVIADELKIREKQKLSIHRHGKKIIIEDWKP
jgi:antitoxin component of MazEF toxin-antitoxin module